MNDVCKHQVLPPVLYLVPHFSIYRIYWFMQISVSQQTSSRMHVQTYQQALHQCNKNLCNLALKQTHSYSERQSNYLHLKRHLLCSGQFNCSYPSIIIQYRLSCKVLPWFCLATLSALIDPRESSISKQNKQKKSNQTESRQCNTAQASIKEVFMLRKVQRAKPLTKVISKGKHAKT